ncbi:protein ecdysoneless homolog [Neosynchiropus ocellatus]
MDQLQKRVGHDDEVQYKLFLVQPTESKSGTDERLSHLLEKILAHIAHHLMQYIWQNQPFKLKFCPEKDDLPAHIGGVTNFGDNVEDEWFIVYLLKQITEEFPMLAAKVVDSDGEFLLIEVADSLPKWLNPDTSENRVFIYRGELHILPCPSRSSPVGIAKDVFPEVAQALDLLHMHPEACRANAKISSLLNKRLCGYQEKVSASFHRAHCFIPAGIALVLAQRPDLLAPAVSAFYLRDPLDLQACRNFKTFPPDTRVLTSVTFTRCLYAQLQQQQFTPDRRSGFNLPPRSHPKYNAHELGMKLAHGFEILCSISRLPSSEPDSPVSCNPQWKGFMDSLKKNGYFRDELEGSVRHKTLMRSAENFFKRSVASGSSGMSCGEEVLQLLRSCPPFNLEELRKQESQLPPEDSDSWLYVTAQDLERMLGERSPSTDDVRGQRASSSGNDPQSAEVGASRGAIEEEEAGYNLVALSQGMKSFLSAMSSHEGAELPWSSSSKPFSFDPDSVTSALDRLLGGKEEEELDSDDLEEEEEDEEEEVQQESPSCSAEVSGTETLEGLRKYMDQMDEELMSTNIGQSFSQTADKKGPEKVPDQRSGDAEEEIQPLDLDLNLVTNLLESLSCQAGLAGPASNLLHSLGIHLPPNSDPA